MTKKAERLIDELCLVMPLAIKKGNTCPENCTDEKSDSDGMEKKLIQEKSDDCEIAKRGGAIC